MGDTTVSRPTIYKAFPTLQEAIHSTATRAFIPMKELAAQLDYSPRELSMRTTLDGENGKPFPANDDQERLILLQRVTGDVSVLATMADLLGFEIVEKRDRTPATRSSFAGRKRGT